MPMNVCEEIAKALKEAESVPRKSIQETLIDYKEKYKGEGHQDMREAFKCGANYGFNRALDYAKEKRELEKEGKEDKYLLVRRYSEVMRAADESFYKWKKENNAQ